MIKFKYQHHSLHLNCIGESGFLIYQDYFGADSVFHTKNVWLIGMFPIIDDCVCKNFSKRPKLYILNLTQKVNRHIALWSCDFIDYWIINLALLVTLLYDTTTIRWIFLRILFIYSTLTKTRFTILAYSDKSNMFIHCNQNY